MRSLSLPRLWPVSATVLPPATAPFPLVGTPDRVADQLEKLSQTGLAGTTLAFVDYAKEFPYFRDEVLPRLERKGLRQPFKQLEINDRGEHQ